MENNTRGSIRILLFTKHISYEKPPLLLVFPLQVDQQEAAVISQDLGYTPP